MGDLKLDLPNPDDVIVGENDIYKIDMTSIYDYENDELEIEHKFYKEGKLVNVSKFLEFKPGTVTKSHYSPFILVNTPNIKP